jgi:FACT complex subunit SPT16 N-terminal lobe domain
MGDIVIDKHSFMERLSGFLTQWKNDKRTGDGIFNGVNSMFICVGKASEASYTKTAAFQVCRV